MSEIENIINGKESPPLQAIKTFDSPAKMAQHFRDIKAILVNHISHTKEIPKDFAEKHIILCALEDHFFALAIKEAYLLGSEGIIN
jgi:hypothetical protein